MTKTQKCPVPWCEGGELPDGLSHPWYWISSTSKSLPGTRSIAISSPVASGTPTIRVISRSS